MFRIGDFSDFLQIPYAYVLCLANSEYDSENWRKGDFHGECIKEDHKNHGFLRLSHPIRKISQKFSNKSCRFHSDANFLFHEFLSRLIVSVKIRYTSDEM